MEEIEQKTTGVLSVCCKRCGEYTYFDENSVSVKVFNQAKSGHFVCRTCEIEKIMKKMKKSKPEKQVKTPIF